MPGVAGWGPAGQAALKSQVPAMGTGTTSTGDTFQAATLVVDDYNQCGGTGGVKNSLSPHILPSITLFTCD